MAFDDDAPVTERMLTRAGPLDPDELEDAFFRAPEPCREAAVRPAEPQDDDTYDPLLILKMSAAVRARRARLGRLVVAVMAGAVVLCVSAFGVEALAGSGPAAGARHQPSLEKSAMRNMHSAPYERSSRR